MFTLHRIAGIAGLCLMSLNSFQAHATVPFVALPDGENSPIYDLQAATHHQRDALLEEKVINWIFPSEISKRAQQIQILPPSKSAIKEAERHAALEKLKDEYLSMRIKQAKYCFKRFSGITYAHPIACDVTIKEAAFYDNQTITLLLNNAYYLNTTNKTLRGKSKSSLPTVFEEKDPLIPLDSGFKKSSTVEIQLPEGSFHTANKDIIYPAGIIIGYKTLNAYLASDPKEPREKELHLVLAMINQLITADATSRSPLFFHKNDFFEIRKPLPAHLSNKYSCGNSLKCLYKGFVILGELSYIHKKFQPIHAPIITICEHLKKLLPI